MTKLLLVDDEKNSRIAIEAYLSTRGFAVRAVSDGEKAVALGMKMAPDVLVCDWLLPGKLGGLDVACTLLEAFPNLAVLIISGLPRVKVAREAGDLPIAGILAKPVGLSTIEDAVRDALSK